MIQQVLDELWYRTVMNNRGWKTLARALVLAHTGMRASQVKRLDPDIDIRPFLTTEPPFVQVSAGKGGRAYLLPLTSDGKAAFLLFLRVGAHGGFSTQAFYKSWMLACGQADVTPFNPYKLRHSFATNCLAENQPGCELGIVIPSEFASVAAILNRVAIPPFP